MMWASDIIKHLMHEQNLTYQKMAELTHRSNPGNISGQLRGASMTLNSLLLYLQVLNCDLIVVHRGSPDELFVVDNIPKQQDIFEIVDFDGR